MSSNNKKAFKQATISSFFKKPKTKEVVNESPSYTNVNLSQFKKVQESKNRGKRMVSEEGDTCTSEQSSDISLPNKRRNIYKSYHHALQKFKFSTVSQEYTSKSDSDNTVTMDTDNDTPKTPLKKSLNIGDLSKFSSSISSSSTSAQSVNKPQKKIVYTPLEQQYLEIKKNNPNMLLAIEVGYKYRFFDDDALVS